MFISFSFCLWELFCACLSVDLSMLRDSLSPIHPLTRDSFSFSLRGSAAKERVVISVAKLPWNIRVTELMFRTFHVELLVFHGFFFINMENMPRDKKYPMSIYSLNFKSRKIFIRFRVYHTHTSPEPTTFLQLIRIKVIPLGT